MKKTCYFLLSILFFLFPFTSFAAINFTVSPIKYEVELAPGESQTYTASIKNNGTTPVTLPTATSDFKARDGSGVPAFVRKSELVFPDQHLSTWITLSESSVTLAAGEEKTINFTINVPENATPGGKYAAVFFKNPGSETSTSGNIGINVDYGVLILLKVKGKIVVDPEIQDPIIKGGNNSSNDDAWYLGRDENGNPIYIYPDICPLGDFTKSKYDTKCFDFPFHSEDTTQDTKIDEPELFKDPFEIEITIPIDNKGNTHVKPSGQIILKDEDGNVIKAIGKESITNDYGAIIGEKVVDYIPFNDEGGNVLPDSKRLFQSYWKGFPYQDYDDAGNIIIKYWSPSEYYTKKNKDESGFLMFWERVSEVRQHKKITALIEIRYPDENGKDIVFNSAKDFEIQYIEEKITLNPYILLGIGLILLAAILLWILIRWWLIVVRRKKCWNCKKEIKAHWETCPYCESVQNKRKMKQVQNIQKEIEKNDEPKKENITSKKQISTVTKKINLTSEKKKIEKTLPEKDASPAKRRGRPKKTNP